MAAVQPPDALETSIPDSLYKYCPPERIDILENMALRFSPPSEFNDTFDSHYLVPRARGRKAIIERFRLKSQLGILCLTERSDDHVMWVQYAHNHTGFVLGLDTKAPFFGEEGRILRKVVYQTRPNVLSRADLNACFYKSSDWQHEKEWRCVREFKPSEFRLIPIEPTAITAIIFGHRMESWRIAQLMIYAKAWEMTHTQFFLSSPSKISWTMQNKPKTMSVCTSCGGNGYLMSD